MGSAETSGVSDKGFEGGAGGLVQRILTAGNLPLPALLALVATLASAGFFVGNDMARSQAALENRAELVAALAAAQVTPGQLDALVPEMPTLSDDIHIAVLGENGEVLFSSSPEISEGYGSPSSLTDQYVQATAPLSGESGEVAVFIPRMSVLDDLAWRHGWVLAALFLGAGLIAYSTRKRSRHETALLPAMDAVPYGLAHWSEDGLLVCTNRAFARLLRLDANATVPGIPYADVSKTIAGRISARPVLDMNRQRVVEVERADGSVLMLDERPCPSGGFVTIVTDITERKAADRLLGSVREEQRLLARRYHEEKIRAEASSRAKTSFLSHLSHDIRTPLNHIIGFAEMIRMETFGPLGDPKYQSYVTDIKCAGEKLLKSFAEILEFAELEAGRKTLRKEPIAIDDLLSGCSIRFAGRAAKAGVRLDVARRTQGWLAADRHYLDRMMTNLIENALRFTPAGGVIRVAAWPAENGVVLEVTDTGIGMNEEQMSKLSQPFVLPDAAFTREHDGVGLGIAIARAVAEQSGGRLAIDSLEGIGTTVAISLPMAPAQEHQFPTPISLAPAQAA
ncbi:sensor histidine kinase [Pelagibacterium halotolerans]|uniref:histidine kinase n=1 Tax=Pelagibacterium halotolerans (strain DSM 22347 / JCM 15775 / CGMCC 1.7692 / B2) TaxID=1082931 RepID=G4RE36_PELHB|nr:HAMP domain-containing sensor histidine kinase [Pelagibacterium halotolerans]AEQ50830.1 signal transduction histidine kinase [Pelagibacterium halotolerans B2]QJR19256.1 HAMP domain-containing histidine kinase [Pelagibacterium halotolerans]SDZ97298.1 two-component system, cell cycle sensor histidine kinase PleC [Pelagibacterium halotolerans]